MQPADVLRALIPRHVENGRQPLSRRMALRKPYVDSDGRAVFHRDIQRLISLQARRRDLFSGNAREPGGGEDRDDRNDGRRNERDRQPPLRRNPFPGLCAGQVLRACGVHRFLHSPGFGDDCRQLSLSQGSRFSQTASIDKTEFCFIILIGRGKSRRIL